MAQEKKAGLGIRSWIWDWLHPMTPLAGPIKNSPVSAPFSIGKAASDSYGDSESWKGPMAYKYQGFTHSLSERTQPATGQVLNKWSRLASWPSTRLPTHASRAPGLLPELEDRQTTRFPLSDHNCTTFSNTYPHPKILGEAGFLLYGLEMTKR